MPRLLRFKAEDTVADQDDARGDTPTAHSGPAIQLFDPRGSLLTLSYPTISQLHPRRENPVFSKLEKWKFVW
jgi:hypothetical protein